LQTLFDAPTFTSGETDDTTTAAALFWMPLIALYSGARQEELAQLRVADFHVAEGLGTYYEIHDRDENRNVKNSESVRNVPVHPALRKLGLLRYVDSLREAGETLLFPKLTARKNGERAPAVSHAFGRLCDELGLTDDGLVFHSLRHTFITYARESRVGDDVRRAITGHAEGDVHGDYGEHTLRELFDVMKRYRVPDLDLSKVRNPFG
jgi:integrase